MASISKDGRGWRILFTDVDGARKTLRLGRVDRKAVENIRCHVEALLVAKQTGTPVRQETACWLSGIGDVLRKRLARAGLVDGVSEVTLAGFLSSWLASREGECKTGSIAVWRMVARAMIQFLGAEKRLNAVTARDAENFRQAMVEAGLRPTTIHKRLQHARMFFTHAKRAGLIPANPFEHVKYRAGDVSERRAYVPVADAMRVIEHCPNVWWRLLVALSRFAGLRIPSEAFSLRWSDVDWERGRLTVPSPKTEGHGKSYRVVPLFPLVRPYLEEAFEMAPEGAEYVMPEEYRRRAQGPHGWRNANLRTTFAKIIRRAGLELWPRLWHSLRESAESDLAQAFPLAVVTKWLGNTPSVALRHYVDPTDDAFAKAATWVPSGPSSDAMVAQNPTQQALEMHGILRKLPKRSIPQCNALKRFATHINRMHPPKAEGKGFEPVDVTQDATSTYDITTTPRGTESGAGDDEAIIALLVELVDKLTEDQRRRLLDRLGHRE